MSAVQLLPRENQVKAMTNEGLQLVQAAIVIASAPALVGDSDRDIAATHLRDVAAKNPSFAEVLHGIIKHIEAKY